MNDAQTATSVLVSLIEQSEGARFELKWIAASGGVALAFYRRDEPTPADEPTLLAVLLDEESPEHWEASHRHAAAERAHEPARLRSALW